VHSRIDVNSLFIGRSAVDGKKYAKMEFGSLGLFEYVLSAKKMEDLFLAGKYISDHTR